MSFIAVTYVDTTDATVDVRLHPRAAAHKSARPSRTRELAKSVLSTTQLNSGLHGKVGSIEKWLLIVIVVLGAVCLLCCVCCIIHVGTCGIL